MRRAALTIVGVLLATTSTNPARADDPRAATLVYSAPDECPDAASFRDQVSARLGADPFVVGGTRRAIVTIERTKGKLTGRVTFASKDAEPTPARELAARSDRCAALVTALATTVAIELDAVSAPPDYWKPPIEDEATPTEGAPPIGPPTSPPPQMVVPPEAPEPPPPRPPPITLAAFAGLVASVGVTPALSFGPDVGAFAAKGPFALELSARAESTFRDIEVVNGDRVRVSIYSAALTPCFRFDRFDACVQARVGAFVGRAASVSNPHDAASPYVALAARVGYAQPLGRVLALRGGFELGVPLGGTTLEVDGQEIWSNSAIFGTLSLSLVAKFTGP